MNIRFPDATALPYHMRAPDTATPLPAAARRGLLPGDEGAGRGEGVGFLAGVGVALAWAFGLGLVLFLGMKYTIG